MNLRNNSSRLRSTRLSLESLEDRHLLTVLFDSLSYLGPTQRVAQNAEGHAIELLGAGASSELIRVSQPEHGQLELDSESGEVVYTPESNYVGLDSFEFTTDQYGFEYTQTMRLSVIESVYGVPDWMLVSPGSQNAQLDVLRNDFSFGGGLVDDNALRIISAAGAEHGLISISDDGTHLAYTPTASYQGSDSLHYVVEDSFGNRSTASITVEVAEFDDPEHFFNQEDFNNAVLSAAVEHYSSLMWHSGYPRFYEDIWVRSNVGTNPINVFTLAAIDAETTNVQVSGVDEGDIAKTDGNYLYLASGTELRIVDIRNPQKAQLAGQLSFEEPIADLYVADGRLTVITELAPGTRDGFIADLAAPEIPEQFTVHVLDVTEPAEPELVYETTIDGDYRDSRLIDGRLYAIASNPFLKTISPQLNADGYSYEAVGDFVGRVQELLSQWTGPSYQTTTAAGTTEQAMIGWKDVARSSVADWGSSFVTITTLDTLDDSGLPTDRELAAIDSYDFDVYVSHNAVYIMSASSTVGDGNAWTDVWFPVSSGTEIQRFSFEADGSGVELTATGEVSGRLSDQFSVDEYEKYFRIATTSGWAGGEVSLFVLTSDSLDVVSSIEDIAPNERIYSTRFDGERAFVTTYRKVDPLFVIDLSDPAQPTIEGSLKIPGYSNYLQVIDENHVLGIGRDANGGLYAGLQISLFNVADPSDPQRVATYTFEGDRNTWSSFADAWDLRDHHAITYVAEEGVLALPFYTFGGWGGLGVSGETLAKPAIRVFQIDTQSEQINVLGQIDFNEEAKRTLHVDGHLYAISDSTLHVTELLTPDQVIASVDLNGGPEAIRISDLEFAQSFNTDMNGDGQTSMADAELFRDAMRDHPFGDMAGDSQQNIDIDGDGHFTPRDILIVVNQAFEDHEPLTEARRIGVRIAAAAGEMGPFQVSAASATPAMLLPSQTTAVVAKSGVFDLNAQSSDQARAESLPERSVASAQAIVQDDAVARVGRVSATSTEHVASDERVVTDAAFAQLSRDELLIGPILM